MARRIINDQAEDIIIKSSEFNVCAHRGIDGFLSDGNRDISSRIMEAGPPPQPNFYVTENGMRSSDATEAAAAKSHLSIANSKVGLFGHLAQNKHDYDSGAGRQGRAMNEVFPSFMKLHAHIGRQVNGVDYKPRNLSSEAKEKRSSLRKSLKDKLSRKLNLSSKLGKRKKKSAKRKSLVPDTPPPPPPGAPPFEMKKPGHSIAMTVALLLKGMKGRGDESVIVKEGEPMPEFVPNMNVAEITNEEKRTSEGGEREEKGPKELLVEEDETDLNADDNDIGNNIDDSDVNVNINININKKGDEIIGKNDVDNDCVDNHVRNDVNKCADNDVGEASIEKQIPQSASLSCSSTELPHSPRSASIAKTAKTSSPEIYISPRSSSISSQSTRSSRLRKSSFSRCSVVSLGLAPPAPLPPTMITTETSPSSVTTQSTDRTIAERVKEANDKLASVRSDINDHDKKIVRFSMTLKRQGISKRTSSTNSSSRPSSVVSEGLAPPAPPPPTAASREKSDSLCPGSFSAMSLTSTRRSSSATIKNFLDNVEDDLTNEEEASTYMSRAMYNDVNKYLKRMKSNDSAYNPFSILSYGDDTSSEEESSEDESSDESSSDEPTLDESNHQQFIDNAFYVVEEQRAAETENRDARIVSNCPSFIRMEVRTSRVGTVLKEGNFENLSGKGHDGTVGTPEMSQEDRRRNSINSMENSGLQDVVTTQKFAPPGGAKLLRIPVDDEDDDDDEDALQDDGHGTKVKRMRERDLSDTQFYNLYGMTRSAFFALPLFKRAYLRQKKKASRPPIVDIT